MSATTLAGAHESLDRADRYDGVYACLGIHPHEAAGPDADHVDELLELFSHPRAVALGETGLDYFRDYAPHDAQQRLFDAQLGLALEVGKPVVIHSRAADDDTRARLVRHDGPVILHCFSSEPLLPAALEHGWYVSFAGNVTYKNAYDLRAAARRIPADRLLVETDSPYLAPQAVRGRRNEPAYVVPHAGGARAGARGGRRRARAPDRRERERGVLAVSVAPRKSLGQHFLVDDNILDVIGRLAELDARDVVLEVGPGLGVLTRYLAARVAHVHAVELDRRLEEQLAGIERTDIHWGDALRLDLDRVRRRRRTSSWRTFPTTSRPRSWPRASRCPQIELWCVMVQREVADRFFASPSTKAYGAVSVLVQLAAERTGFHPVSREVFRPRPNVDSALVAFRRVAARGAAGR